MLMYIEEKGVDPISNSRKQQQIFITLALRLLALRGFKYDTWNQRTRLPHNNRWNHDSGTILKFVYFMFI